MIAVYTVDGNIVNKEVSLISFRVPLSAISKLQELGRLGEDYNRAELSNIVRTDWLATLGVQVPVVVDGSTVASAESLSKIDCKLNEVLDLLRSQRPVN